MAKELLEKIEELKIKSQEIGKILNLEEKEKRKGSWRKKSMCLIFGVTTRRLLKLCRNWKNRGKKFPKSWNKLEVAGNYKQLQELLAMVVCGGCGVRMIGCCVLRELRTENP